MKSTHHHNARSASLSIIGALLLTFILTFAAKSAEGATFNIGIPYYVRAVVPVTTPITSHDGKSVVTRGFDLDTNTSAYLACATNEYVNGYDVAAVDPFVLTNEHNAGVLRVYSNRNRTSVVIDTVTPYKHVALVANIGDRLVEVEVICSK